MFIPFLLFGTVIYFGVRAVLEREQSDELVHFPIPQVPQVPQVAQPAPTTPTTPQADEPVSPAGWPSGGPSYATCETFMSTLTKDELRGLLQQISAMTDEQWATARSKMVAMGQGQMASCLDSTRQYMKTITKP